MAGVSISMGGANNPSLAYGNSTIAKGIVIPLEFGDGVKTAMPEIATVYNQYGNAGCIKAGGQDDKGAFEVIMKALTDKYGEISKECYNLSKKDFEQRLGGTGKLHDLRVWGSDFNYTIIKESRAREAYIEFLLEEEAEYVGYYNLKLLKDLFPKFSNSFESSAKDYNYEAIGLLIVNTEGGIEKLVDFFIDKYGAMHMLAECMSHYDNTYQPFTWKGEKYGIFRTD